MSVPAGLTRADLERLPRQLLSRHSAIKPSVWRVDASGGPVIVKDVRGQSLPLRWLARWLLSRERRVLEHLAGMQRVPQVLGKVDRDAIALSLLPGHPLDAQTFQSSPRELVGQLRDLIEELHARGVFHLDLHQRKNLLVDDSGKLQLLDFGAAVVPGPLVRALAGRLLRWIDRQSILKFLARFAPEMLTREEALAVLRYGAVRRLWPFTTHRRKGEQAARQRLG